MFDVFLNQTLGRTKYMSTKLKYIIKQLKLSMHFEQFMDTTVYESKLIRLAYLACSKSVIV